ncbi:MAG: bifunctional diaminohydroxyphosphoribosylaminopyrimidine deaminase/5-amino-6-(5-phosphoribosylamino)uracil reductase RibD [Kiritimatiellae bacterium]|nr:bifunctional diaminohydroxyphosphoribosylaminopyrimidine deaminase/5-amino-6-(5-phosphoribosylamino)uracil reductase RibD [Kiritimatiellia bacterium]MDW8458968.1 bifunctional diaminohydroxyphosphoribosylaminopyrimidine deaminase/5-amino-6-(5-phosphoribosylamino)uracil reductase RibD [Verrucomicrobiota bacterium]
MRRAIELARRGEGLTRPNPPVGAVIVKNGGLVAEGYHERAGGPHAEVVALQAAGERSRGADLYVTLEPCSTWGRTPPCTDAILRSGIRRVVAGVADPNPRHGGRGFDLLRASGISVTVGVLEQECARLIEPFACLQRLGRPFVTLKLAMTLDGRIADERGRSRWISGEQARNAVHRLRARVDGIMVGRATAALDNPTLLPNPSDGRRPWRIVLDPKGRLPFSLRLFRDRYREQTLVLVSPEAPREFREMCATRGIHLAELPAPDGRFRMRRVLGVLGSMGLLHVVCEGGGELAGSLIRERLVDEAWFFYAPKVLGASGRPSIGGGWRLHRAPLWRVERVEQLDPDILVIARPLRGSQKGGLCLQA